MVVLFAVPYVELKYNFYFLFKYNFLLTKNKQSQINLIPHLYYVKYYNDI